MVKIKDEKIMMEMSEKCNIQLLKNKTEKEQK